jgi:hypothetical protein
MHLKLLTCSLFLLISYASFTAAHGHSHDGVDHAHSHGNHEDSKPSFKYSKQANEEVKKQANPSAHHGGHGHDCHGHSHDEPKVKREVPHQEKLKQKEVPSTG